MRRLIAAILGSDKDVCTKKQYKIAYEVGKQLALNGIVVLTGGGFGVMEAACKGAKKMKGLTVGVTWGHKKSEANRFCDIVLPSGIGFARDQINSNAADAVILVGGGVGTLSEATYAYFDKVPIIAMTKSGGTAQKYSNSYLDKRRRIKIIGADTVEDAINIVLQKVKPYKKINGCLYKRS